ncbi:Uncharacterised protein [Mycobacterium tuberculosis]|nr:Uncharacterised protein [Mycobacterium tuberculosis]
MASSELFTADFWQRTITQAVHGAAGGAIGAQGAGEFKLLNSVPWYAVLSAAAIGALLSLLTSVGSVKVPGTVTASLLPQKLFKSTVLATVRKSNEQWIDTL